MGFLKASYKNKSDEALMNELIKGNKAAFDEIYDRYAPLLFRYFMRMLWRDKEKAEDFVHDLFAKIIRKPDYFDPERSFKTWIYSVANNMCKNEYKKQEIRQGTNISLEGFYAVGDGHTNVFNDVHDRFFKEAFLKGLDALEQKHREVFVLRHLDGLSIKEIAEVTAVNEGTVKSRLFYATKYLAEILKEFNPVGEEKK